MVKQKKYLPETKLTEFKSTLVEEGARDIKFTDALASRGKIQKYTV